MKKTKIALTLVCAILIVAASVMGTLAYLTAQTGTVTNTFTVGSVEFDATQALDEAKVNQYGEKLNSTGGVYDPNKEDETLADRVTTNTYKLVPGHSYVKDPTVHIGADSENAWLFVKVVNPIADIEDATTAGNTIAAQMTAKGWTAVAGATNVYAYKTTVSAGDDITVFETFKLADTADVSSYAGAQITIQAGLIQADGFATAAAAWAAAGDQLFVADPAPADPAE